MPVANVNGVRLFYELNGTAGVPLVFVHGAWTSHHTFDRVAPKLGAWFRVIAYDRRGHSQSERPAGQGSVWEDVADLAALIEHLGIAPAWVVGSSAGGAITLRLAGERPDLLQGIITHEPAPLFSLIADDPHFASLLEDTERRERAVVEQLASGDHRGAAEQFVEKLAFGPGSWERLLPTLRDTMVENAVTYLDDVNDPEVKKLDLDRIARFNKPALLTLGDQSPPFFAPIARKIARALPRAEVYTFPGAGHVPYNSHPDVYVEIVTDFIRKHSG